MKKLLSFLLAILLIVSVVPLGAFSFSVSAATDGYYTDGYYTYYVSKNGAAAITYVDFSIIGKVTIPSTLGGYPVTGIGTYAFSGCTSLTSITIPDSVTYIGNYAFQSCTSLTSITISDNITSIGDYAFQSCDITNITIPDSVTSISEGTFYGCSSLTSIAIPDSVTSIGERAFYGCSSLTSITISDNVTSIGDYAFCYCDSLTQINVDQNNDYYSSIDGVLFNKDKTVFIQYPIGNKATSYIIPDSVTSIGNYAFSGCSSLTSITIPNSVTSIGIYSFYRCNSLTQINVDQNNNYYCSIDDVLFNKDKTVLIKYPAGNKATSYTVPDGVTSIGERTFDNCDILKNVTISDNVTSIGNCAFYDCDSLTNVTIGNSVTSIDASAFGYCDELKNVYYRGTESQKENIYYIGNNNENLIDATWYYESCIDSATHTYANDIDGNCNICGYVRFESTVVSGDVSGDGEISGKDCATLMQYINGKDIEISNAADVNADGKVNNKDYILLVRYLNGWDVELK